MNDPRLDPDTVERMLRGEPTGPLALTELLAAASAELAAEDINGEEAAVAAFREARRSPRPSRRRLSALVSVKAALIGLLLLGGGVTAVAATSQHLPGPLQSKHSHRSHPPTRPRSSETGTPSRTHPTPDRPTKSPQKTAQPAERPHPTTKPRGKRPKSNPHEPRATTGTVSVPDTGTR